MNGTLSTQAGRTVLRFERKLRHPAEKVFRALTEPAELKHWFPAEIHGLREMGASLRFVFEGEEGPPQAGTLTEFEPPKSLAFTWGDETLRFELTPDSDGCVLVFTATFEDRAKAPRDATGWHMCLDGLGKSLDGATGDPACSDEDKAKQRKELYANYLSMFGAGDFPSFMKSPKNRVARESELAPGVEGYVFDGAEGTQVAFWIARQDTELAERFNERDEYLLVLEGSFTFALVGQEMHLGAGQEFEIPNGARISGRLQAGTRLLHVFGGKQVAREGA